MFDGGRRAVVTFLKLLLLSLRSLGAPTEANRDQLRQAQANYARRNTRGTVGGADGPPGVYKYIIYIYISIRAAFAPLHPR